ncbi:DnaJ-domain-containing protein [Atractiella rhizophila]|nr:DnaJ-domain-containing protein [Atractiella rhizophila]
MSKPCLALAKHGNCVKGDNCIYGYSHSWPVERLKGASMCKFQDGKCKDKDTKKGCPFLHPEDFEKEHATHRNHEPDDFVTRLQKATEKRNSTRGVEPPFVQPQTSKGSIEGPTSKPFVRKDHPCIIKATLGFCNRGNDCPYAPSHSWPRDKLEKASQCTWEKARGECKRPWCKFVHLGQERERDLMDFSIDESPPGDTDGDVESLGVRGRLSPPQSHKEAGLTYPNNTLDELLAEGRLEDAKRRIKEAEMKQKMSRGSPRDVAKSRATGATFDNTRSTILSQGASANSFTSETPSTTKLDATQRREVELLKEALKEKEETLSALQHAFEELKTEKVVHYQDDPLLLKALSRLTYYELLNVTKDATLAQIRKAFLEASLKYHPDLGTGKAIYDLIDHARSVLADPVEKRKYDKSLSW